MPSITTLVYHEVSTNSTVIYDMDDVSSPYMEVSQNQHPDVFETD